MLRFHNTLTRKKEEFKPLISNEVKMYSCGPTVYNYAHIGNFRSFIFVDLLRRYLKYKGFKLNHVMNITDVDDKTIRDSLKDGKSLQEFTQHYTAEFLSDLKTLNVEIPEVMPKATDHIPEMVELIKTLKEKGNAYERNGTTYFSISSFKDYGKLANLDTENLKKNADGRLNSSDEYEKDDARDFALWKPWEESDGDVFWETDIGKGRPGWHIECSAMSTKYLGETFDIHTGGVDLVFPHHTNEIAQSECAHCKTFVNYWLHNEHLFVNGEKMSKSAGNFFTLRDLLEKGYSPMAIRYQFIASHYRQQLNFTEDALKQTPQTLQRFYDFIDKLESLSAGEENSNVSDLITVAKKGFEESMDDDLNISGALAAIFDFMREINKLMSENKIGKSNAKDVLHLMNEFNQVLGVFDHEKGEIAEEVEALIEQRQEARKNKDFAAADKIRDDLKEKGIILEDTKDGVKWKKIN